MPSLAQRISLIGGVLLLIVALLGGLTTLTLVRLEATNRQLAENLLEQQRLLNQFQIALNSVVRQAAGYARTGERGSLQDARDALEDAQLVLKPLAMLSERAALDGFAADRQAQRELLVADTATQLVRLTTALNNGNTVAAGRALQRLELIAQDTATLARIDALLLDRQITALNAERRRQFLQGVVGTVGTFLLLAGVTLVGVIATRRIIARPLQELESVVQAVGAGQFDQRVTTLQAFEIGRLQAGVNRMAAGLQEQQANLIARTTELEQLTVSQGRLLETVNALGTPLLPISDAVLVLPVVGHIDAQRADQIEQRLLAEVYQQRVQIVVLDLTGLASTDAAALDRLMALAGAVRLLGAQVVFAGISATLALHFVDHRTQIGDSQSYRTLGDAISAVAALQEDRHAL